MPSWLEQHYSDFRAIAGFGRSGVELELTTAVELGAVDRALALGLDKLALANAVRRGGLVIDLLAAVAFESMAIERLRSLRSRLDGALCVQLANAIIRLDEGREPFDDIVRRDVAWEQSVGHTGDTISDYLPEPPGLEDCDSDDEAARRGQTDA